MTTLIAVTIFEILNAKKHQFIVELLVRFMYGKVGKMRTKNYMACKVIQISGVQFNFS